MSDATRIIACKTMAQAAHEAGLLQGDGFNVAVIKNTDAVELIDGSGTTVTWESGSESDWILVIGSLKGIDLL